MRSQQEIEECYVLVNHLIAQQSLNYDEMALFAGIYGTLRWVFEDDETPLGRMIEDMKRVEDKGISHDQN